MPLATFSPPVAPSPGTRHAPKVNLFKAEFGDGYTQAAPAGLNHIKQSIVLRWDGLTESQFDTIRSFLEAQGGYRPFYYQPRSYAAPLKWVCEEWSGSDSSPWRIEAKLEQHFTTET